MIGKIMTGSGFAGTLAYCLDENGRNGKVASIIASSGVLAPTDVKGRCAVSSREIARSFHDQAALNMRVRKPVKHVALSWKEEDMDKLSDSEMARVAEEYMNRMGYVNTQYLVVRHSEKNNPHCHIILNAVDRSGKRISDSNERIRNVEVCRRITDEHGFELGMYKFMGNMEDIRNPRERCRYYLARMISVAMVHSKSMEDMVSLLKLEEIDTVIHRDESGKGAGISFSLDFEGATMHFSGGGVCPKFTLRGIESIIQLKERIPELQARAKEMIGRFGELEDEVEIPKDMLRRKKELQDSLRSLGRYRRQRDAGLTRFGRETARCLYVVAATILFAQPAIILIAALAKFIEATVKSLREQREQNLRKEYGLYCEAERTFANSPKKSKGMKM